MQRGRLGFTACAVLLVVAVTPQSGAEHYYHYDWSADTWLPGLAVSDQGPCEDRGPVEVLNRTGLEPGDYTFYFGVDPVMNGDVDRADGVYDQVEVKITR